MKPITGLFALIIAIGIAAPAQALPNYVESRGVAYVANLNGGSRVSALVTSTGAPLWTTSLTSVPSDISLSLALDKDVLFVTGYSESVVNLGYVWAISAVSGQILWVTALPGGGIYSSAVVEKDIVYVAGAGTPNRTTALNAETGAIVWQVNTVYPVFSSPTIAKESVVLVTGGFPGFPTFLIVVDAATGSPRTFPVP